MEPKCLMNYAEAEKFLNITKGTLQSMVCRKEIPHIRLGKRSVRFNRDEIQAWLAARSVAVAQADSSGAR